MSRYTERISRVSKLFLVNYSPNTNIKANFAYKWDLTQLLELNYSFRYFAQSPSIKESMTLGTASNYFIQARFYVYISFPSQPRYWEFIIDSIDKYSVYSYSNYLKDKKIITDIKPPKILIKSFQNTLNSDIKISLKPFYEFDQPPLLGIAARLRNFNDTSSLWAPKLTIKKFDFHNRINFFQD